MKNKFCLTFIIFLLAIINAEAFQAPVKNFYNVSLKRMPDVLPGTQALMPHGDLSINMLDGAHIFIERKINESIDKRLKLWSRDLTSPQAYESSVEPNRKRLIKYIGVEDKMTPLANFSKDIGGFQSQVFMQKVSNNNDPEVIAETNTYRVYQVRWPVLNKIFGEGILLQPKTRPIANIIVIPDADQEPEQLVGLLPGVPVESQFARRLAENGYQVLIPQLISRKLLFDGKPEQQTYREWIWRQAFHMGRHIIGFEVQKILSAIDWFKQSGDKDLKIGVAGYFEGGLIAFYSAAVDKRIDAVLVSGYFTSRQKVWDEPIYRSVWGLLSEFGDAEIASLIAPRSIVVEYSVVPAIVDKLDLPDDSLPQSEGLVYTGYKGRLQTPKFADVQSEFNRIDKLIKTGFQSRYLISGDKNIRVPFGSQMALEKFTNLLGFNSLANKQSEIPVDNRRSFSAEARQMRQVKEMEDHVQSLLRDSDEERNKFFLYKVMPEFGERNWSTRPYHPYYPAGRFIEHAREYRKFFNEEILGAFDDTLLSPNVRTRKIYDNDKWSGFEVVLDVYPDLFANGILLIPKDIKAGEKRPVVVCQHGRSDIPQKLIDGNITAYNNAAAKLADQGFIVYVPQNPYRWEDRYRWLNRKANTIKKTLFSFIVSQHDQTLRWLGRLPFVDKNRIALYGLSFGGQTALRIPAVLEGYCLSICSGYFGDEARKTVDIHFPASYMNSIEWDAPYFNMGNTFSHAENAYLIFPRPFMVERGHHDMVQPDEWVAYEYGKVKYFYDQFNLGDKTEIEFFNGGHSMRSDETFKFLHKHLNWPVRKMKIK